MELKRDDTPKNQENTFSERPSVNDALFGNTNLDTPYQVQSNSYGSSSASYKKNDGSDIVKYAIIALIALVLVGLFLNYQKKIEERNGKYELISASRYGITYSVEELEKLSGMDIYASITIDGKECAMKIDYTYIKMDGTGKIKFRGNKFTISDCSDTLTGDYDPNKKTLSFESSGTDLCFKKVD